MKTFQQALLLRDLKVRNEIQGQVTMYFPSLVGGPPVSRTLNAKETLVLLGKESEYTNPQVRGSSNLTSLVERGFLSVIPPERKGARA